MKIRLAQGTYKNKQHGNYRNISQLEKEKELKIMKKRFFEDEIFIYKIVMKIFLERIEIKAFRTFLQISSVFKD